MRVRVLYQGLSKPFEIDNNCTFVSQLEQICALFDVSPEEHTLHLQDMWGNDIYINAEISYIRPQYFYKQDQPVDLVVRPSVQSQQAMSDIRSGNDRKIRQALIKLKSQLQNEAFAEEFIANKGLLALASMISTSEGNVKGYLLGAVRDGLSYVSGMNAVIESPQIVKEIYQITGISVHNTTIYKNALEILIVLCSYVEEGFLMIHETAKAFSHHLDEEPYHNFLALLKNKDLDVQLKTLTLMNIMAKKAPNERKRKRLVFYWKKAGIIDFIRSMEANDLETNLPEIQKQVDILQSISGCTIPGSWFQAREFEKQYQGAMKMYEQACDEIFKFQQQQPLVKILKEELLRCYDTLNSLSSLATGGAQILPPKQRKVQKSRSDTSKDIHEGHTLTELEDVSFLSFKDFDLDSTIYSASKVDKIRKGVISQLLDHKDFSSVTLEVVKEKGLEVPTDSNELFESSDEEENDEIGVQTEQCFTEPVPPPPPSMDIDEIDMEWIPSVSPQYSTNFQSNTIPPPPPPDETDHEFEFNIEDYLPSDYQRNQNLASHQRSEEYEACPHTNEDHFRSRVQNSSETTQLQDVSHEVAHSRLPKRNSDIPSSSGPNEVPPPPPASSSGNQPFNKKEPISASMETTHPTPEENTLSVPEQLDPRDQPPSSELPSTYDSENIQGVAPPSTINALPPLPAPSDLRRTLSDAPNSDLLPPSISSLSSPQGRLSPPLDGDLPPPPSDNLPPPPTGDLPPPPAGDLPPPIEGTLPPTDDLLPPPGGDLPPPAGDLPPPAGDLPPPPAGGLPPPIGDSLPPPPGDLLPPPIGASLPPPADDLLPPPGGDLPPPAGDLPPPPVGDLPPPIGDSLPPFPGDNLPPPNASDSMLPPPGGLPPQGLSLGAQRQPLSSPAAVKPRKKMKPLFWNSLKISRNRDTIWAKLPDKIMFDEEEFYDRFSVKEKKKVSKKTTTKTPEPSLLDSKLHSNISIMLHKLPSTAVIQSAVLQLDTTKLSKENLANMIQSIPPKDTLGDFVKKIHTKENLSEAEKFVSMTITIPEFTNRVTCWLFSMDFSESLQTLERPILQLEAGCKAVKESQHLPCVLAYVLKFGNFMNHGTPKGNAQGFGLDVLPKLDVTKDKDNKGSLLKYLVETLRWRHPDALEIANELADVHPAAKLHFDTTDGLLSDASDSLKKFKSQMKNISKSMDKEDPFMMKMAPFYVNAKHSLEQVEKKYKEIKDDYKGLIMFFGLPPKAVKKPAVDDVFGVLSRFLVGVEKYLKGSEKRKTKAAKRGGRILTGVSGDLMSAMVQSITDDLTKS